MELLSLFLFLILCYYCKETTEFLVFILYFETSMNLFVSHNSFLMRSLGFSGWFLGGSDGKVSAHSPGDPGLIPGSGRSPGKGNCNPLQYSCLENSMDGGAWWATVHAVAKSRTRLSDFTSFLDLISRQFSRSDIMSSAYSDNFTSSFRIWMSFIYFLA